MRNCCGSNDHPDSTLFIQMYKLVSTYSLIKPPKGSNVSGGEIVDVLLSIKDIKNVYDRREQWDAQIDTILDKGVHAETLSDAVKLMEEHDYFQCSTSDYVLAYVAGFVVRKATRFAKYSTGGKPLVCNDCLMSLERSKNDEESNLYKLIHMRTKGYLKEPSMQLFNLISLLEQATLKVLNTGSINVDTIFHITQALDELAPIPFVGCDVHKISFTHRIISFFLTTRMFFIVKQENKNDCIEKEKTREKRKLSKLSYAPDNTMELQLQNANATKNSKRRRNLSKTRKTKKK